MNEEIGHLEATAARGDFQNWMSQKSNSRGTESFPTLTSTENSQQSLVMLRYCIQSHSSVICSRYATVPDRCKLQVNSCFSIVLGWDIL